MSEKPPPPPAVAVADTSVCSDNLGDQIIMDAFWREMRECLAHHAVFTIPTHSPLGYRGKRLLDEAQLALVAGTNLVPARPHPRQLWRLPPLRSDRRKFVLVGCGFGGRPDRRTVPYLRSILHPTALHSCRDQRTTDFLAAHGFRAINTGCITAWSASEGRARASSGEAILILNASLSNAVADRAIVAAVQHEFERVHLWLQAPLDRRYLTGIGFQPASVVPGGVDGLRRAIGSGADVVTTRLHAALFAMHLGAATTLFALDERTAVTTEAVGVDAASSPRTPSSAREAIAKPPLVIHPRAREIREWNTWLQAALGSAA